MKKTVLVMFCMFVVTSAAYAGEKAPLGAGNIVIKVDYINFTAGVIGESDVDKGLYLGIEGFKEIADNFYLGAEVGYANPQGSVEVFASDVETDLTFVPIELNLKYAAKPASNFVLDAGIGASYNYVEEEATANSSSASDSGWVIGGQIFIDLHYTMERFFAGINGKYQITEDFEDADYNYNNWRIGGQLGFVF